MSKAMSAPVAANSVKIPTFDMRDYERDPASFARALGDGFRQFGFVALTNHGVPEETRLAMYEDAKAFFALPEETKRKYYDPALHGQRGFTPMGVEGAKDSKLSDMKEFWHYGRQLPQNHPRAGDVMKNISLDADVPTFDKNAARLYESFETLGNRVMTALAIYLGEQPDFFRDKTDWGDSILRLLHYPPILDPNTKATRGGAHEDINLITFLVGSGQPGLQVLSNDGVWIPVDTIPGTIVCNIGDMLQRWTNKLLPSTTHRVVNPDPEGMKTARYSMPFFMHPNNDVVLSPLPQCVERTGGVNLYPEPITALDYLLQRLFEIGLVAEPPKATIRPEEGTFAGKKKTA